MVAELTRATVSDKTADRPPTVSVPMTVQAGVSVLVATLLIVRITVAWSGAADTSAPAAVALLIALVMLVAFAILSAALQSGLSGRLLDVVLLIAGSIVVCTEQRRQLINSARSYPSDEGRLVQHAIAAVASGHDPYSRTFPDVAHFAGNTPLFGGGGATLFGYPPLSAEVGALLDHLHPPWGNAGVVGLVGLLATAVVCVVVLPAVWRTVALGVVLGLPLLTTYAINGHPAMLALPLLCLACARWSRIGTDGRLGLLALLQAGCLGLAAAAQQLAWFPALGLLLSLWLVRRGALGSRPAALLTARFAGVAAAGFVLVNLPFIAAGPGSWQRGVLAQFTGPHPVPTGQGLVALALVVHHGGGAFDFFSYATIALLLGLLLVTALGFRRLAAVVPLLLTSIFLVAIRSQGEYFLQFAPLWVVWAAGTDAAVVAAVSPLVSGTRRYLVAAAALVPAAACVVVAVVVPPPLRLAVASTSERQGRVTTVRLVVDNLTGHRVVPHYYLDPASHLRSPWRVVAGPRSLAGGQRATVTLRPALLGPERPAPGLRVWAVSPGPEAMSSTPLPSL